MPVQPEGGEAMGEGGEKKKNSSLRGRVARSRQTYARKSNPMPLVIGVVVLAIVGIGLYVFLGTAPTKRHESPAASGTTETATDATSAAEPARAEADTLFKLLHWARIDRKDNPGKALADLCARESKYGDVPDFQVAKAMTINEKIARAQGNAAKRALAEEKLRYLEKARELLDAGKAWDEDPIGSKTGNLGTSLEQCKLLVDKYTN